MPRDRRYRNEATDGYVYSDLAEYGYDDEKEKLIPESIVVGVIDKIESDVNEIKDLLDNITGLTEIEDIKDRIAELSIKLY